ncbi:MAG TPA: hypothetical protein VNI60_10810 [Pyrinomonadaceae bacterium]|nr:hypothetical protein [Pyrinomonadaceae bacterium]
MLNSITDDEYYSDVNTYTGVTASRSEKTKELESKGWEHWLKTVFPFAFEEDFSNDQSRFWELWFSLLIRIREQKKYYSVGLPHPSEFDIDSDEFVYLLIWGRALGKSATLEASSVMRGAMLDGGYCLYISEGQGQAEEHIENCRILIEHDQSRLQEFYPDMRIDSSNRKVFGMKTKDAADLFITSNGWICRAKGLTANLRGLRKGGRRPDDINIDDIDGVNDSINVSFNKLKELSSSVIPTQAKRWSTIKVGQNLITETGVVNQIYTGKSGVLSARTPIGVSNTFVKFEEYEEYETYIDEKENRVRWRILPAAIPTWAGVSVPDAQKFLDDSSIETFIAEYMNNFEHLKTEKVFHEFSEKRQIITWSDFEKMFGTRFIPHNWNSAVGLDIGYSENSVAAWTFMATSPENSSLPGRYFVYRSLTFTTQSIDNQAFKVWQNLFPDPQIGKRHFEANQNFKKYPELRRLLETVPKCRDILRHYDYNPITDSYQTKDEIDQSQDEIAKYYLKLASATFRSQVVSWRMSHEKTGEQITLAQKYGLPLDKTKHFGKEDGLTEANNLLRGDFTVPHPFRKDAKILDVDDNFTGLFELGAPYLYFIVADNQKDAAFDDDGMAILRAHLFGQRWTFEKMTETGFVRRVPMKFQSDGGDSVRMITAEYKTAFSSPLSEKEKTERALPKTLQKEAIAQDIGLVPEDEISNRQMARDIKLNFENPLKKKKEEKKSDYWGDAFKE